MKARGVSEKIFCAFCRIPRQAYTKKHVTWINVVLSVLAGFMIMFISWQGFDARVCILSVFCLAAAEAFIQFRWRLSVSCNYCGFDPVLYIKDQPLAKQRVIETLERKKRSPSYLMSDKNPYMTLPKRQIKTSLLEQRTKKEEPLLSKQI